MLRGHPPNHNGRQGDQALVQAEMAQRWHQPCVCPSQSLSRWTVSFFVQDGRGVQVNITGREERDVNALIPRKREPC